MRTVPFSLSDLHQQELERRHRAGYERKPVQPGEFSDWEAEQVWPEELHSPPDER